MRFAGWGNFILWSVLTLVLAGPIWADGMPETGPAPITDYGHFLGELQAGGALQFYDNSEEILRLAQFERALMRYRFLKGQIQRSGDYRGLSAMVDLRLQFLKRQLHLHDRDIAAIPARKARIPKAKPPEAKATPKKDAAAKPKPPGPVAKDKDNAEAEPAVSGQLPGVVVIPGLPAKAAAKPPGTPQAAPPAAMAKPPEVVVTDTPKAKEDGKAKEEKAEEEKDKEEAKPAPPPPSFWEKMKIRLHLQKKAAESGKAPESGS